MKHLALAALLLAVAAPARGQQLRFLGASDFFVTTAPPAAAATPNASSVSEAELGLTLKADVKDLGHRWDLHLDFRPRIGFTGNATRTDLFALDATVHLGRVDLTFGRFAVPGNFWLMVDGASLHIALGERFGAEVYGGLRAFTTGRVETHLTQDFLALPLAGAAISFAHPLLYASASFTYAQDQLAFYRGNPGGVDAVITRDTANHPLVEDELFLNANLLFFPHKSLFFAGAVTFGSRYDFTLGSAFDAANPNNQFGVSSPVTVATLGSFDAHALAEWRPWKRLRLAYLFDFDRVRILQSKLLTGATTAGGSFEDHTIKASWRLFKERSIRVDVRYRLRFRETTDVIHRVQAGVYADDLIVGLGLYTTVGLDEYQSYAASVFHQKPMMAGQSPDPSRIVYEGGLSFVRQWLDARVGLLYTDSLAGAANVVQLSNPDPLAMGTTNAYQTSKLFPFVLDAQRIAYLRVFGNWRGLFAGVDAEMNLDFNQLRLLAQLGYAR